MTTAVIVQARMTSTRLPGKVLAPVMGRPLLSYQLERLRRSRLADLFILATTNEAPDDAVAAEASRNGWAVYRGSRDDVLSRFLSAATLYGADYVVRSTADCPLIDPSTIDMLIARYRHGDADHVEIAGIPNGMGAEIISRKLLERIALAPDITDEDREHVTLYVRRRPSEYRKRLVDVRLGMDRDRWTVDEEPDLAVIRAVFEALYPSNPSFTFGDVADFLRANPRIASLNCGVSDSPIDVEMLALAQPKWAPWLGDL